MSGRPLDPDEWKGDTEKLVGYEEALAESPDLCDLTFSSKHDAFINGLSLGFRLGDRDKH